MRSMHPDWIRHKKKQAEKRAKFIESIDEAEKSRIIEDWVIEYSLKNISVHTTESEKRLSICMFDPDLGWEMILRIMTSTESKLCLSRLGAWHIENWFAIHGEVVIDRVESMASKNLKLKRLLSRVYQNSMSSKVYQKVRSLAVFDEYFNG